MKKIINEPTKVVSELLKGMELAHPELVYTEKLEVIARREKSNKVAVISGGGAGHEPAHAGYVGKGMLDAAISGNVFSSPSPDRIIEGIKQTDAGKGVLMVIKNYSGDIMNFGLAKDLAELEDIEVESVVVRDDVAVPDSTYSTGRRGIAGTVFVHKIAGAKAESGANLQEVKAAAEKAIANIRSMGMAMTPCILPAVGKPGFVLEENEIEIGMGIHGEPGVERTTVKTAKDVAKILLDKILEDYDFSDSEVALLVNGLGGTPLMELYILNKEVQELLVEKNIKVYKTLVGNYMTALDMSGCSITLMKLDEELKELLDAPCNTPGLTIN
ncbi:MAG TPA: dihydroxyacetone kinase subunit DhaK [Lachnoclostridium phytofermentans]|uniref:phosphoenolpyruvate--glycerone phosphotransferase n=1 Tax=Lachnoclostridium phytofermentans TaxID=66219 RepID=A0A3D2X3B1_9FIRM|nr:dihydroxyacetone kinase subunit DhaK [Lachnoclostridium sp.]HCL01592.1 dihydroxyacetone kinase subunit DhaK [Lachnoclostridium phytofermentans]